MSSYNEQIERLKIDRSTPARSRDLRPFLIICSVCFLLVSGLLLSGWLRSVPEATAADGSADNHLSAAESTAAYVTQAEPAVASYSGSAATGEAATALSVLDASGHIVARRIATVSSRVTGKVTHLHIEEGMRVLRDTVLAELDDQQADIALRQAIAQLHSSEAALKELQVRLSNEERLLDRRERLHTQDLISDEAIEQSRSTVAQMSAQAESMQARIESAEQIVAMARYQLNQHKIRAPFDGIVISKNAQVGELLSAGNSGGGFIRTGVGTIVDMNSLEIEVEVGEAYIDRVRPGQSVRARLDAYPDWSIASEVVAIIPAADRQKASIKVRVRLLENDPRILPDMSVKVSFLDEAVAA